MQERAHSPSSHKSPLALREAPTALVLRWRRRRAGELIEIESVEVEAEVPGEENEPVETIEKPDKPHAPAFEEDEPSVDSFSTFASDEQRAIAAKSNGKPSGRAQLALTEGKLQLTLKAWSFENGRRRYGGLPNDALKTRGPARRRFNRVHRRCVAGAVRSRACAQGLERLRRLRL